ncbi:hypothetical protein Z517_06839 [Fonsecaea pedrosoi CBS 271.37]|uniref:Ketoreductase domain-containing protein n=1 Tax=Fonsecaea pedrosoi CBS 271.37 TaxID=1442368 RepID=A0A0D2H6D6_9EURO|nr:uncharacterized protein Z517_06839 [Fonsecaea pedrosoi CBS 271.37]KIW80224.1 hypothetical protein Z517_06839 [Fonsecaea pedrosoi CBS 271.37]
MAFPKTLAGKVIAIVGAGSGIGLAFAKLAAGHGAQLSLADVSLEGLERATTSIQQQNPEVKPLTTQVDVCKVEDVERWVQQTVSTFGGLDGAVNCAGILQYASISSTSLAVWSRVLDVNLTGTFLCMKTQLEVIRDGGSIVNLASIAGLQGHTLTAAYTASKHGVVGISKVAAYEVGHRNIRVNALCPGVLDTPMTEGYPFPMAAAAIKRKGTPEEVAHVIRYLLSDESRYVTASALTIDGGFH